MKKKFGLLETLMALGLTVLVMGTLLQFFSFFAGRNSKDAGLSETIDGHLRFFSRVSTDLRSASLVKVYPEGFSIKVIKEDSEGKMGDGNIEYKIENHRFYRKEDLNKTFYPMTGGGEGASFSLSLARKGRDFLVRIDFKLSKQGEWKNTQKRFNLSPSVK